jgi:hypothetical protein
VVAKNEHLIHPVSKRGKEIKNRSLTPSPCIDLRLQKNNNNKSSKDEKPSFSICHSCLKICKSYLRRPCGEKAERNFEFIVLCTQCYKNYIIF